MGSVVSQKCFKFHYPCTEVFSILVQIQRQRFPWYCIVIIFHFKPKSKRNFYNNLFADAVIYCVKTTTLLIHWFSLKRKQEQKSPTNTQITRKTK